MEFDNLNWLFSSVDFRLLLIFKDVLLFKAPDTVGGQR